MCSTNIQKVSAQINLTLFSSENTMSFISIGLFMVYLFILRSVPILIIGSYDN